MTKIDKQEFESLLEMFKGELKERWSFGAISSYYSYYFKCDWWKLWKKEVLVYTVSYLPSGRKILYYKREGI